MSTPTFLDEADILWDKFSAFSRDQNNSKEAVVAAEKQYDADYAALLLKHSRPSTPPDRRR